VLRNLWGKLRVRYEIAETKREVADRSSELWNRGLVGKRVWLAVTGGIVLLVFLIVVS